MKNKLNWLLALGLVLSAAGCSSTPANEPTEGEKEDETVETDKEDESETTADNADLTSFADYVNADLGTMVTMETYVQAKQSWWQDTATLYTQNEDGAIFIYNASVSEDDYAKLVEGQKIRVTGARADYAGEIEIGVDENGQNPTIEIIDGNWIAPVTDITDLLGKDEIADHQNEKVSFKDLTVAEIGEGEAFLYNYNGSGSEGDDLYFNVEKDGEIYQFTVESYLCDSTTDVYKAVQNLQVGDVIDAEGFLYWYNGINPHITSITVK